MAHQRSRAGGLLGRSAAGPVMLTKQILWRSDTWCVTFPVWKAEAVVLVTSD